MKKILLILFILNITLTTKATILEFRGIIIKRQHKASVKFYTSLDNKDYYTTILYEGPTKTKNKNIKYVFKITENQNNKYLKTYTVTLSNKNTLKINDINFKFLFFRGEFIFLKIEEKEKYAKLF